MSHKLKHLFMLIRHRFFSKRKEIWKVNFLCLTHFMHKPIQSALHRIKRFICLKKLIMMLNNRNFSLTDESRKSSSGPGNSLFNGFILWLNVGFCLLNSILHQTLNYFLPSFVSVQLLPPSRNMHVRLFWVCPVMDCWPIHEPARLRPPSIALGP